VAGTVAGAMSMAAGEYVSVQTQADTEAADLAMESASCAKTRTANWRSWPRSTATAAWSLHWPGRWPNSLPPTMHWVPTPAMSWASLTPCARPLQAALASAGAFTCGAALPVLTALLAPTDKVALMTTASTLLGLCLTGAVAAQAGAHRLYAARSG
jgi:VIT1/CCC1 family predicted Fe2+/Mn2+ transporter